MYRFILLFIVVARAHASGYPLPSEAANVIGEVAQINAAFEDTFVGLGRSHGLGYEELVAANPGVDPWLPGVDTPLVLPKRFILPDAPRDGIVLNLAELRLYYFRGGEDDDAGTSVQTWPVSVGDLGRTTPTGVTTVVDKLRNPVWYPPQSIIAAHAARGDTLPRIVPPGPDNPLGELALQLGFSSYLIHGTNRPAGIGMRITNGCIRMQPADIEALAEQVPRGTPVRIVNQPYKMGWADDALLLEVHPPFNDDASGGDRGMTDIVELYVKATARRAATVDWPAVERVFREARGVPVAVGTPAPPD